MKRPRRLGHLVGCCGELEFARLGMFGLNEEIAEHRLVQLNPEMTEEERKMHQRIVAGLSIAKDIVNEEFALGKDANAVMQATINRSKEQRVKAALNKLNFNRPSTKGYFPDPYSKEGGVK